VVSDNQECRACRGPTRPWLEVASGEPSDLRRYLLLRCEACGSAVTAGHPPGAEAYEYGVYAPGPPRALPLVRVLQRVADAQPARILRRAGVRPGGRILDAGAGRGRLVGELRRRGYAARGIDPSGRGENVSPVSIAEHADSGLDAVVLWHVIEHLDDPLSALERVRAWLRPGGVLLVGVPNAASLQAKVAGPGWLHWDAPRHRLHLTPRGLATLLSRAGLEPGPVRHMVWEHNPAGMWMALLTRAGLRPGFPFHLLKRNVSPRARDLGLLAAGLPLVPVATLIEAGSAAAHRGGTIAQVATRA
jgi:SAM-dependent methyltransferase